MAKCSAGRALHQPGGRELLSSRSISTRRWSKARDRRSMTIDARSSTWATSASMRRRARSASTRRASTCRTRIYLAKVNGDHSISFPKVWEDIKPYWLGEAGCDLTKKDPNASTHPAIRRPRAERRRIDQGPDHCAGGTIVTVGPIALAGRSCSTRTSASSTSSGTQSRFWCCARAGLRSSSA